MGAQEKAVILLFLDGMALDDFRKSDGWEAEVDESVAVVELGAGGSVDTTNIKDPIIVSRCYSYWPLVAGGEVAFPFFAAVGGPERNHTLGQPLPPKAGSYPS